MILADPAGPDPVMRVLERQEGVRIAVGTSKGRGMLR